VFLRVKCEGVAAEHPAPKDSIAIDGACLTVTRVDGDVVTFDVVPETLARTSLRDRRPGDPANVEYALRAQDRLGGHLVYGHVDVASGVLSVLNEGQGKRMRVERPSALASAIVEKGFVAIDGVSLTVAAVGEGWFEVALIPETLARTTLGLRAAGDRVNLEIDPFARYAQAAIEAMRR
jgi:riboflavin synthase